MYFNAYTYKYIVYNSIQITVFCKDLTKGITFVLFKILFLNIQLTSSLQLKKCIKMI